MARYTDEQRSLHVIGLQAMGYPDRIGALSQYSRRVKIPRPTLRRWYNREQNPPPDKIVQRQKRELVDIIDDVIRSALGYLPEAMDDSPAKDLAMIAAIMIDKQRLLDDKSTENVAVKVNVDDHRQRALAAITSPLPELEPKEAGKLGTGTNGSAV